VQRPDDLLGRRVALRHRIGERDGRPLCTDAVGELAADGGALVVHTRRGPVRVERDAVVAVRAIPPPAPRRPSWAAVARLGHLCADALPAPVDRPLGAWRLRAAGGVPGADAGLVLGDPGMPVPAALDAVRAFAAEHRVPPRVQVPEGSPWERAVAAAGWLPGPEVVVRVADIGDRRFVDGSGQDRRERRRTADHGHRPAERPTSAWWVRSLGREPTPDERLVLDPGPPLRTAFAGGVRAALVGDHGDHVHLWLPNGDAGLAAAVDWARAQGARWAVLQVPRHDGAARAVADRLGAAEHHRTRYLVPPG
jgi:hypothetical protein